jgi:hypothetical protein
MARRGSKKKKPTERELRELEIHDALRRTLEEQGWRISTARSLSGKGGHCIVHGQRRVILQGNLPVADRIDVLVEALRQEDLDGIHLRPDLRELVEPGSLCPELESDAAKGDVSTLGSDSDSPTAVGGRADQAPSEDDATSQPPPKADDGSGDAQMAASQATA